MLLRCVSLEKQLLILKGKWPAWPEAAEVQVLAVQVDGSLFQGTECSGGWGAAGGCCVHLPVFPCPGQGEPRLGAGGGCRELWTLTQKRLSWDFGLMSRGARNPRKQQEGPPPSVRWLDACPSLQCPHACNYPDGDSELRGQVGDAKGKLPHQCPFTWAAAPPATCVCGLGRGMALSLEDAPSQGRSRGAALGSLWQQAKLTPMSCGPV